MPVPRWPHQRGTANTIFTKELTMTTAHLTRAGHERPCFCDTCLGCTVLELLDQQAGLLHAAIADGLYEDGFERQLAENLITAIPAAQRSNALEVMVHDHLQPRILGVDCLLDECEDRSYGTVSAMSRILLDEIHAQDRAPYALMVLVTKEVCELEKLIEFAESRAA
jgi:hypothetical protein